MRVLAYPVVLLAVMGLGQVKAAIFTGLGHLPGHTRSVANDVSPDGTIIVGTSGPASQQSGELSGNKAFQWTIGEGMTQVGGFASSHGNAVSSNGVFVGSYEYASTTTGQRYILHKAADLNSGAIPSGGNNSVAHDVSADGTVKIGVKRFTPSPDGPRGFRNNIELKGIDGREAEAYGISGDGQVVVGNSLRSGSEGTWTEATIWSGDWSGTSKLGQGLGRLGNEDSAALAISSDGQTIVGESGRSAVRFTGGPILELGSISVTGDSKANAVSADGSIIVGQSGNYAFIWDEENGMRDLSEVLTSDYGLNLDGWDLSRATGISDDGETIIGYGLNPFGGTEAWVANVTVVPEPSSTALIAFVALGLIARRRTRHRNGIC
ncbi:PEP-CTERM sorting domain-containing protein [Stieleria sp. ICT_E10.1]|uniref:PEP-CTERM sorting domain-containing protein n=1 Tax=Stieleria sedimenti TaxID=2976331 RepID=UPI00217FBB6C|nr:PEP-CTERM sorting domain-containing protein [Stieleria sedimenti]MCS7466117.1 PEP-CTERM sorting domain-containing protein [Stieleria sedimenti]